MPSDLNVDRFQLVSRIVAAKKKPTARGKKQERLSLAPLTPEEAIKRVLGGASKETRPESMVPRGKPKSPKKSLE
jgi:hypothetical protein